MKSNLRVADGLELSLTGLKARPGRTALTALGIAFGIAAIVAVLGISNDVGPSAHTQWLTYREEAQEAARKGVLVLLQAPDRQAPDSF